MKTNKVFGKVSMFTAVALLGMVAACKNDEGLSGGDATVAVSESLTDSYYEDADDISVLKTNTPPSGATRVATDDDRLTCATIDNPVNNTTSGSFDVNFGTGCVDPRGNTRVGVIHITWEGTPGSDGFTITETFTNYSINGVKLEGTRTLSRVGSSTPIVHTINLENGKATWPDASYAERTASFTRTYDVDAGTVKLEGSASGTNRDRKPYSMEITNALIYKLSCIASNKIYMAVEGTRLYTNTGTGKTLTIDYGTGDCDRSVTITVGRLSFNYTINK